MRWLTELIEKLKFGNKRPGLRDEKDERNFGAENILSLSKSDIPNQTFIVFDPTPLDQYDSDFCVGYGGAYVSEATEQRVGSGAYLFAMAKKIEGRWNTWGTSILNVMKARVNNGVCEYTRYNYQKGRRDYYANWDNIPKDAHEDAAKHKGESFFQVNKPWGWSMFDTLKATLWKLKDKKVLIQTGNNGHNITIIGYNHERGALVARDSYGDRTYEKGLRYIYPREAENLFTPYFVLDMPRSLAELLIEYNNKAIKLKGKPECYLVKDGKKRYLKNEEVAWAHGVLLFYPENVYEISKDDFDLIPTGEPVKFEEGKYWQVVKRIYEKNKLTLAV